MGRGKANTKKKTVVGLDDDVFELLVKACGKEMMLTGKFCSMTDMATKAVRSYVEGLSEKEN